MNRRQALAQALDFDDARTLALAAKAYADVLLARPANDQVAELAHRAAGLAGLLHETNAERPEAVA